MAPVQETLPGMESEPSSWQPADLAPFLDGSYQVPRATLMPREDGAGLLYPGKVHSFVGESESGKSLLAQLECIRLCGLGEDVLYVDFEDQAGGVVGRLVTFGAERSHLLQHFHYISPERDFRASTDDLVAWRGLLERPYALVVIDGVNDSLSLFGKNPNAGDEVSEWQQQFARRLARKTGAAVLLIDHVTKAHEGRGRSAIGSEKKLSGLDGCSYTVEPTTMPRKGHVGWIDVKIGKDRPGGIRPHCGPPGRDRLQLAVTVKIDSTGEIPQVWWNPPTDRAAEDQPIEDKLALAMLKVSAVLEEAGEPLTKNAVCAKAGGSRNNCMAALDELQRLGYVEFKPGPRSSVQVKTVKPYINEALVLTDTPLVPGTSTSTSTPVPTPLGGTGTSTSQPEPVTSTQAITWDEALANVIPLKGAN